MLLISCLKILYHEVKATIKHNETNGEETEKGSDEA